MKNSTASKKDILSGSTNKGLFLFALPMIFGNLLQQFYNIADSIIVGKFVNADALGAVGSAYSLITFLTSVIIGLCMGSGAVFSFYRGKNEPKKLRSSMLCSFVLTGSVSVILTLLMLIFLDPVLFLLKTPDKIFPYMRSYSFIVITGIIFVFLYNFYAYLLRSSGDSVTPLVFLGITAVLNVGLDLVSVLVFKMGLEGTAYATVFSQAVSGIGLMVYTHIKYKEMRFSIKDFIHSEKPFKEISSYSAASSLQQSVMNFGILMIQGLVNSFGPSVMTAFAAAVKIDTFAYMPAQEFANAYSIFVSRNNGAGNKKRIKEGTKSALIASVLFCAAVSAAVVLLSPQLMTFFVDPSETEIIKIGVGYLHIEGAFYALIGILFLLYGYFRGLNRPLISLLLTIISLGLRVLLANIFSSFPAFGVYGIWWSIPIGWLIADAAGFIIMFFIKRRKNA